MTDGLVIKRKHDRRLSHQEKWKIIFFSQTVLILVNYDESMPKTYEGESIIIRTVCFILRKTRAVDQTGESEAVRSRLHRGCSNTLKFSFLRFSTVWAVSASVMDVDWRPVPSPCVTLVRPFLNLSLH